MRWPDPLVDFARNLYLPWRMSQGALLYQDVFDWYGPLPHLVAAAVFRFVGPGLDALVALNLLVALTALTLLRGIFRTLGGALSAWVASVIFVGVYAFGQYTKLGNYNFATPYVTQATWGLTGVFAVLWALLRHAHEGRARVLFVAGAGLAVTVLSKPEACLAAAGALALSATLHGVHKRRLDGAGPHVAATALGFLAVWGAAFVALAWRGGAAYAWSAANHAILFALSDNARAGASDSPMLLASLGFDAVGTHLVRALKFGAAAMALCWCLALLMRAGLPGRWRFVPWGLAYLLSLAAGFFIDWHRVGEALLVPVVLTCAVTVGFCVRRALAGHLPKHELALALVAASALLMLARMILNVRIFHYGFVMTVLAVLVLAHVLVHEIPTRALAVLAGRPWFAGAYVVLLVVGSMRLAADSLAIHALKTVTVGEGRDAFLALGPAHSGNATLLSAMVDAVKVSAPNAKSLVAFPESGALGYALKLPSPIPAFEFNPVSLAFGGQERILKDLQAHPPDVVVLYGHGLATHGAPYFGADAKSGQAILSWVLEHYRAVRAEGTSPHSSTGHAFDIFVPR